jgi:multiple sugar transport system substrate-binding protein
VKGFKRTSRALLATGAAATMALAACSGSGNTPAGPGPLPTDSVQLTFWWWGSPARAETTQKVIELFEAEYPFIDIVGEPQDFANYFQTLGTRFGGGDAPDIITMGGSYVLSYAEGGNLLDLRDPSLAQELDTTVFSDSILTSSTYDGTVYGVPTGGNSLSVFANPAIFEAAGVDLPNDDEWTWDDFAEIAAEITEKSPEGTYGAEMRSYDLIGAYAGQQTPLYDAAGNLTVTADTIEGLWQLYVDLIESGGLPPADLVQQVSTVEPAQTLFGQGRSALFFGYTNQLGTYAQAIGAEAGTDNAIQLLRIPGESQYSSPGTTLLPSQYYTINGATEYPRQAALFVDFLVNSTAAGELILTDRGVPSSPEVLAHITPLLTGYNAVVAEFLNANLDNFGPGFLPPAWATELNSITQRVESEVIFGEATPAEAAASWIEQMEASKAANS